MRKVLWLATLAWLMTLAAPLCAQVLDDFEAGKGNWTILAPEGVEASLSTDAGATGQGLRLDYALPHRHDFVIAQKPVRLELPENFVFTLRIRSDRPLSELEFKLIDKGKHNVSWAKFPVVMGANPSDWQMVTLKRRHFSHAWGSGQASTPLAISAIEIGVPGATSRQGSIWIDDLQFVPIPRSGFDKATIKASSAVNGQTPERLLDDDAATGWRSAAGTNAEWLLIDLKDSRPYDGITLDWDAEDYPVDYRLRASEDGETWSLVHTVMAGHGGQDLIFFPPRRARYLRFELLRSSRGQGFALKALEVRPEESSLAFQTRLEMLARGAPRGNYPRYLLGEQSYWTVVGQPDDTHEALINEDGMIEVGQGQFSLQPFVFADGELVSWGNVTLDQSLEDGYLPIPSVRWKRDALELTTTAYADGVPGATRLFVRYRVTNHGGAARKLRLFVAVQPFQVNPPWQSLNGRGGLTMTFDMRYADGMLTVNRERAVVPLTRPDRFGAAALLNTREFVDYLRAGDLPHASEARDPDCYVAGAFAFDLELGAGQTRDVFLLAPFQAAGIPPRDELTAEFAARRLDAVREAWRARLSRVDIQVPPEGEALIQTLKSTLAYVLINRDDAAIQPGSRAYARSWIRDGALTSAALLSMGFTDEVRDFIRWYAQFQQPDGSIPCCVDGSGPDLTPENDSHGQFIYAIAEYFRYTRDLALVAEQWPRIEKTVEYIDGLRQRRMNDAYRTLERMAYFGMLPESISHEGYASGPVHAYWDAFFTLRGLKDAAFLAQYRDDPVLAVRWRTLRDDFADDLYNSIGWAVDKHKLDTLPASVELGDYDPSAIAAAIAPLGGKARLPAAQLRRTFERYDEILRDRLKPDSTWQAYAPYEFRVAEALVYLGQRDRALAVMNYLFEGRRPPGWNAFAEVVHRDERAPLFVGDIPHTWVGSDFLRALRSFFVYEREDDQALVLAAGLPFKWVAEGEGVRVGKLPTWFGKLDYHLRVDGPGRLTMDVSGDLDVPPGGIVIDPPLPAPVKSVLVNGKDFAPSRAGGIVIRSVPAKIQIEF